MNSSDNLIDCLNTENHNNLIARQWFSETVTKKRAKCTKKFDIVTVTAHLSYQVYIKVFISRVKRI